MINQESNLIKIAPETQTMVSARVSNHTIVPSSLYDTAPESEHVAYLREFGRSVRKHLWLVLGLVFCATAASIIYNARQPDIFEAKAEVRVDQENNPALNALGSGAPVILTAPGLDPQYFSTQLQILRGPSLMRNVVKALDLEHNPDFFRSVNQNRTITQSVARMFGFNKDDKAKPDDRASAPVVVVDGKAIATAAPSTIEDTLQEARRLEPFVQTILGNLKVVQARDTRIINISYTHQDPQVAAKIVNSIADIYVRSNFLNKGDNMNKEGEFLQQRIAQLQGELQRANQQLNALAKAGNFLELTSAQDVVVARLAALNGELIKAENDLRLAEAQRKVGSEKPVSDAEVAKEIQPMEERLNGLNLERAKLLEIYTPEWRGVKQIDAQITELTKQIQETKANRSSNTITGLDARYREALQREQKLRVAFAQQKAETRQQNQEAVNYNILKREIDTKQKLLDSMIEKGQQGAIARYGTSNNISVQEWGLPPKAPIGPKRTQSILLALMLSLAFGVGLARLLDYLDLTVRTVQDIEKHLRLPVLALIPAVGGWRRIASSTALQRSDNAGTEELLVHADGRSPLAETYRQLRTSILLSTAGRAPKTLLVTSSQASEGKTTNAINIAHTLTQTGVKVLLIDADMRRPRVHSVFQMGNNQGLSTALSSEMREEDILKLAVAQEDSNLSVMTSGPLPPNPSELLSSEAMRRFLVMMENHYTHIVIDSPPITLVTDSVILGSMVDGVLLVVQGDRTSRELVRRSQRLLNEVGARIFGVILNNVNVKPEDYYYYQSYYGSRYYADNAHTAADAATNGKG